MNGSETSIDRGCMVALMSDQGTFVRLSRFANGTYQVCLVLRDGDNEFVIAQGKNQEEVCEEAAAVFARAAEIPKLLRLEVNEIPSEQAKSS